MKEDINLLLKEKYNQEIERCKPEIELMKSEIEDAKKKLESAKSELNRLDGVIKHLADLIDDREKGIQFMYKDAKISAALEILEAQPWSVRISNIDTGPQDKLNLPMARRNGIVIEEVKHRIVENPEKSLTAIYEEMGREARDHRKRCAARTIRRVYENYLAITKNLER